MKASTSDGPLRREKINFQSKFERVFPVYHPVIRADRVLELLEEVPPSSIVIKMMFIHLRLPRCQMSFDYVALMLKWKTIWSLMGELK